MVRFRRNPLTSRPVSGVPADWPNDLSWGIGPTQTGAVHELIETAASERQPEP